METDTWAINLIVVTVFIRIDIINIHHSKATKKDFGGIKLPPMRVTSIAITTITITVAAATAMTVGMEKQFKKLFVSI